MHRKKILFIVNSISHLIREQNMEQLIHAHLDLDKYDPEVLFTERPHHAFELAKQTKAEIVAAVGGDGTVNEVGKGLIGSDKALYIIPAGSGNGLARHLGIPLTLKGAISSLNHAEEMWIDAAKMNEHIFFGMAGIGYDAWIALKFSKFGKRGISSYMQLAVQEYAAYPALEYTLVVDGKEMQRKAWIISFANSSQYGNDFIIAPKAKLHDGQLDLVIVKKPPFYAIPELVYRSKQGTMDLSNYVETLKCKKVSIKQEVIPAHLDGEPYSFEEEITVEVHPNQLKILTPSKQPLGLNTFRLFHILKPTSIT